MAMGYTREDGRNERDSVGRVEAMRGWTCVRSYALKTALHLIVV